MVLRSPTLRGESSKKEPTSGDEPRVKKAKTETELVPIQI